MKKGKNEMTQISIPCSVYRGGTSRGLFFQEKDLPKDKEKRNEVFLYGIDAYNPSQVNGLGGGTSHTSKVVVIDGSEKEAGGIKYTFYQIGIGVPVVDDKGTCGNLMAAVGAYAVNEGLIKVDYNKADINVQVFNTNISKNVIINVPVENGGAKVSGDYLMPGIVTSGAKYSVDIIDPGGAITKKTFPLQPTSTLAIDKKEYEISFVDVVNPFVFIKASTFGLTGNELTFEISKNTTLMKELNRIRDEAAVVLGMVNTRNEASKKTPAVPKIAIVAKAQNYTTTSGKQIKKSEVDIIAKMISMGNVHHTFAGSGLYNLAATTLLLDTIPNDISEVTYKGGNQVIRIGHPDGIAEVRVALTEGHQDVYSVGLERTAREIMKGNIFIPE